MQHVRSAAARVGHERSVGVLNHRGQSWFEDSVSNCARNALVDDIIDSGQFLGNSGLDQLLDSRFK
jgi:hypothetical protein